MIFRLKTSKQTQEIFEELERRTNFKPYTLVKHAIAWSVAEKTSVKDFKSDSNGLDLNRQTITGDNEEYFKAMFELIEGRFLGEDEFFPKYVKLILIAEVSCFLICTIMQVVLISIFFMFWGLVILYDISG